MNQAELCSLMADALEELRDKVGLSRECLVTLVVRIPGSPEREFVVLPERETLDELRAVLNRCESRKPLGEAVP